MFSAIIEHTRTRGHAHPRTREYAHPKNMRTHAPANTRRCAHAAAVARMAAELEARAAALPLGPLGPLGPLCFLVFVFSLPPSASEAQGRPLNERSKTHGHATSNICLFHEKNYKTLLAKMSNTPYIRSNIREYEVVGDPLYSRKILKIS